MYSLRPAREQPNGQPSQSPETVHTQALLNSSSSDYNILSVNSQDEDYNSEVEGETENGIIEEVVQEDEHRYLPKYLNSVMFATIIEDAIVALRILCECNNHMRICKAMFDMKKLLNLKYAIAGSPVLDELYGVQRNNLGSAEYKLNKLFNDRKRVTDIMTDIYLDLATNSSFGVLIKEINKILDREKYMGQLIELQAKNKIQSQELRKKLRLQRNQQKSAIYDINVSIEELRMEIEDGELMSETNCRYVGYWQRARSEQHHLAIREKESAIMATNRELRTRQDQERMVHSEIELLNSIIVNETMMKVDKIMVKYEKDIEEIDLKVQIKRNEYNNMMDKGKVLEKKLIENAKELSEWKRYKEERQKLRDYHDKMHKAAETVQAWWRGILVRMQLGPYKPTKRRAVKKNL